MGRIIPNRPSTRVLQEIKGGSFTVTLPRWWVEKYRLSRGARLFTSEDGCSLRIAVKDSNSIRKDVEIEVDKLADMKSVRYCILTYYMQGACRITLKSSIALSSDRKKKLREIRFEMPGVEITHEDSNSIVFYVTSDIGGERLDDVIMTIHGIALSAHKDSIYALNNNDLQLAREVVGREDDMLRVYRKLIRHISLASVHPEISFTSGVRDSNELITYTLLARDLNRVFYHALYISKHLLKLGRALKVYELISQINSLSELVQMMQQLAVEAFINRDFRKVIAVTDMMKEVRETEERLSIDVMRRLNDFEQAITLLFIARDLRRIAGYSVAMADAAANRIFSPFASKTVKLRA